MNIKSSSSIRNNYREVADECIATGQPTFLTNNGDGELVVMSLEAYNSMQLDLKIQAAIMEADKREMNGEVSYIALSDAKQKVLEAIGAIHEKI